MKPSQAQIDFFMKLTEERDFGMNKKELDAIIKKFAELNQKSASAWIEKAMELPKADPSRKEVVEVTPPPFG